MGIQIVAKKDGFRRCGIVHSTKPTVYPDGKLTAAQLQVLKAEPMLIVTDVPDAAPAADAAKGKGKGGKAE